VIKYKVLLILLQGYDEGVCVAAAVMEMVGEVLGSADLYYYYKQIFKTNCSISGMKQIVTIDYSYSHNNIIMYYN